MTLVLPTPRLALCVVIIALFVALSPLVPSLSVLAFALGATLAGAVIADIALGPKSNPIEIARLVPERLPQQAPIPVPYTFRNKTWARLSVRAVEGGDQRLTIDPQPFTIVLNARSDTQLTTTWTGHVRGDVELGRIDLAVRNMLSLFERRYRLLVPARIAIVPPHAVPGRAALATRNRLAAIGLRRIERPGTGTEFERLRPYTPGDSFRKISWKASARRGAFIVSEERAERSQHVIVAIDCGRLMTGRIDERSKLDYALDAALALSRVCLLAGDAVGMSAFADHALHWLRPGSRAGQFAALREATYGLQPLPCESDYAREVGLLNKRVAKRALVVLFTDVFDPDGIRDTVGAFRQLMGRHLVLIALMNDAAFEMAIASEPRDRAAALEAGTALALLDERRHAIARMRSFGLDVVDVAPDRLAVATIDSYLQIKSSNRL